MKPVLLLFVLLAGGASAASSGVATDTTQYRGWVEGMKEEPRGPFVRLRWFCADGSTFPPQPYACREHGGGHQHGEWSDRTVELRERGYKVANLLARVDPPALIAAPDFDDTLAQMLIERFLIAADDGWIMRRALFYRGAIQEEDERAGGRALLESLVMEPRWVETRFAGLRAGARLLPHGRDTVSAQQVRQESAALEQRDPAFARLRAKIHGAPDASDAQRVREYAQAVSAAELRGRYEKLASDIDAVYAAEPFAKVLEEAAAHITDPALEAVVQQGAGHLGDSATALDRYRVASRMLAELRDGLPRVRGPAERIRLLELSLRAEQETFKSGTEFRDAIASMSRTERLSILLSGIDAAYGCGLLKKREQQYQQQAIAGAGDGIVPLDGYLELLRQLGRTPGWGTQNLRFLFFDSMKKLAEVEPKAMLFIQDQLRGSPLLLFSQILDDLARDANREAGVRHQLFDQEIGAGLKALNPGLAIGTLHTNIEADALEDLEPDGIYVLPETVSDLPPVAGILTGGEGNPLSHVQLLARNLGIPNVNVDDSVIRLLEEHDGRRVVLAVSDGGLVQIAAGGGEFETRLTGEQTSGSVVIRPEPEKLKLGVREFLPLAELRASDSGVTVGPKAAKLGELKHAFPDAVADGVAIPFGLFKSEVLDRPYKGGAQSVFDWMVGRYAAFEQMPETDRTDAMAVFRAELYDIVLGTEPSPEFREKLSEAMTETFGNTNEGVFVRSDTNVEDLPGFTGAGLNLTLPNVVGFDTLLGSISRVWASPFTERAFAWRQSHMENPQHVYTSVLLLRSVAADKSGVLVTEDLDTGLDSVLSVAVNEGVGGAVDGQAAESLRIDASDGSVRLLATATAPLRRMPAAGGGIVSVPVSGSDYVLQPAEIERLVVFARDELPERFPPIVDDNGDPAAADVEFGFENGALRLFQLRPFLRSRGAAGSSYLVSMDKALAATSGRDINLAAVPGD